jgi:hypothetical protein
MGTVVHTHVCTHVPMVGYMYTHMSTHMHVHYAVYIHRVPCSSGCGSTYYAGVLMVVSMVR